MIKKTDKKAANTYIYQWECKVLKVATGQVWSTFLFDVSFNQTVFSYNKKQDCWPVTDQTPTTTYFYTCFKLYTRKTRKGIFLD